MDADAHCRRVGRRLRTAIEGVGLTPLGAATAMGIKKQRLQNWLAGDNYPDLTILCQFAIAKQIDLNFLLLGRSQSRPAEFMYQDADLLEPSATVRAGDTQEALASARAQEAVARHLVGTHDG